ncbi:hypothetical protein GF386_05215 [Candidatus Pacearchaeota archaeon]|nr:hypothetical protein [Candidatus Pacearchaeota archaeon]MBD3283509.1 hypothetical protein [Candidatus Pacearchaeota archaeon]
MGNIYLPLRKSRDLVIKQEGDLRIWTDNSYRYTFLIHCFLYFLQTQGKVPYANDWESRFFRTTGFKKPGRIPHNMPLLKEIRRAVRNKDGLVLLSEDIYSVNHQEPLRIPDKRDRNRYPRLYQGLVYLDNDSEIVLALESRDARYFFNELISQFQNLSQMKQIGIVYSGFPFNAYKS